MRPAPGLSRAGYTRVDTSYRRKYHQIEILKKGAEKMAGEETKNWVFHHVGVIVKDLEKTREYYKSLGIIDFPPGRSESRSLAWKWMTSYGEMVILGGKRSTPPDPDAKSGGLFFCNMGELPFEVIQADERGGRGFHSDFLKQYGEGIDHIAYIVDPEYIDEEVDKMKAKGLDIITSGEHDRGVFYYFDTRKAGGIVTELMSLWK